MRHPVISTGLYLVKGCLTITAIRLISLRLATTGILRVFAGRLACALGVAFFGAKRLPCNHFISHLFVIAGTTRHYFAVPWYSV